MNEKLLNLKYNRVFCFKYIIKKSLRFAILIISNLRLCDKFLIIRIFFLIIKISELFNMR